MKCEFCGTEDQKGKTCTACGAKIPEVPNRKSWKSEPFFYNGYICYQIKDGFLREEYEVQFWLGMELIERIRIADDVMRERVPAYEDPMPLFWDLFLLAHGEKDALEWMEKNNKQPASFIVTRKENPERERVRALSLRELAHESRVTA